MGSKGWLGWFRRYSQKQDRETDGQKRERVRERVKEKRKKRVMSKKDI